MDKIASIVLIGWLAVVQPREYMVYPPPPIIIENVVLTAYSSSENETDEDPQIMANGERVFDGAIANNCEPFGTLVEWGGRVYEVSDRKNKRYGCEWWDIWHSSKESALEFGIRRGERLVKL